MSIFQVIASIVLIILSGFIGGWAISKIKLPKVLGFIIAGIIIGPYGLNFVDKSLLTQSDIYGVFNLLIIGCMGYYIGTEIVYSEIKKYGKSVIIIGLFEAYLPFLLILFVARYIYRVDWLVAAVFGTIALSTAPGPVLSIIKEYKAKGPISKLLMPLAAIDSVIAVITFGIILSVVDSFYTGGSFSILEPVLTIIFSLVLGSASGYILKSILSKVTNKLYILLIFTVLIFATMFFAFKINADFILTGILVGISIRNLTSVNNRENILNTLSKPASLAIVIFLVLLGTDLNYTMLFKGLVVFYSCIYIVVRAFGKYIGIYIGSLISKVDPVIKRYMGITMLPHAGVSLTFSIIAYDVISPDVTGLYGHPSRDILLVIIAAAATINEIISVLTTKWGLKISGEIKD